MIENNQGRLDKSGNAMRVIHCAETVKGGIATYLRDLLPLQTAAYGADRIVVIIPSDQVSELPVPFGVRVIEFNPSGSRALSALRVGFEVWRSLKYDAYSILHVHSTYAGVTARVAAALAGFNGRVLYCAHGWAFDRGGSKALSYFYKFVERSLARLCYRIVCISEHDYRAAISAGLPEEKLSVARNGISLVSPKPAVIDLPWNRSCLRLLFIGRLDRQKGVDILLRSMMDLVGVAECAVVGAGVVDNVPVSQWPENVHSLGWRSPNEIQYLLEACDALLVPSRWEGFGLVALEAMRASKPVIAASVGGLKEIVADGVSGWLFSPNQSDEIVRIVRVANRQTLTSMGVSGNAIFIENYTINRLFSELHALYVN